MAAMMIRSVAKLPLSLSDLGLLLAKDLAITGIWFASLMGKTVRWGDRRFRIMEGGKLEEIRSASSPRPPDQPIQHSAAHPISPSPVPDATHGSR
jgi:hypothetical protein